MTEGERKLWELSPTYFLGEAVHKAYCLEKSCHDGAANGPKSLEPRLGKIDWGD